MLLIQFSVSSTVAYCLSLQVYRYAGQAGVLVGIVLFLMTSFCDPGVINAATLKRHLSNFPFDGIIYYEKDCPTCKIPR
jgi:hypothetical protein